MDFWRYSVPVRDERSSVGVMWVTSILDAENWTCCGQACRPLLREYEVPSSRIRQASMPRVVDGSLETMRIGKETANFAILNLGL